MLKCKPQCFANIFNTYLYSWMIKSLVKYLEPGYRDHWSAEYVDLINHWTHNQCSQNKIFLRSSSGLYVGKSSFSIRLFLSSHLPEMINLRNFFHCIFKDLAYSLQTLILCFCESPRHKNITVFIARVALTFFNTTNTSF